MSGAIKTVGDIKAKVCKDFDPIVRADQKLWCRHRNDDHCTLPTHFVCELYSYKLRMQQHTSVSAMDCFVRCPKQFQIRYVLRLEAPTVAPALWLGSQFHDARARIDEGMDYAIPAPPPNCRVTPEQRTILIETMAYYKEHRVHVPHPQRSEVFQSGFLPDGTQVQAWLDGFTFPGTIFEYKYTAMPDSYDAKRLRRQLSMYFHLTPDSDKAVVIAAKKLALRMSKADNNDLAQFAARVRGELAKLGPAKVFQVKEFSIKQFPVKEEVQSMVLLQQLIKHATEQGKFPCNYYNCEDCEYNGTACK